MIKFIPLFALLLVALDLYVYRGIKIAIQGFSPTWKKTIKWLYWSISLTFILGLLIYYMGLPVKFANSLRIIIASGLTIQYVAKIFIFLFLLLDDIIHLLKLAKPKLYAYLRLPNSHKKLSGTPIARSKFLAQTGIVLATVPLASMSWGVINGAYDYRIRRKVIHLPNLPSAFHGLRIGQISDIHSGSFWNKTAVKGGIEMLIAEKCDLVFFTGDLVNYRANEVNDYIDIFSKVKAPLGTYSILGNHDYGDYVSWSSMAEKKKNLQEVKQAHQQLGWNLLTNSNHLLTQSNEQLAIIGVENWSRITRFPRYGDLKKAVVGTEEAPVKLLLSHDPTHWRSEILTDFSEIDMMFAGHTHGMQFGVETKTIKWSPAQYMYKEWADLYQEGSQYLYVNRGYGFIGFPGRIGIAPEITIFELRISV